MKALKNNIVFIISVVLVAILSMTLFAACETEDQESGFAFTLNDSRTGYVVGYTGACKEQELVIPASYEGLPVVEIKASVFNGNKYIESIKFETTKDLEIGKKAFKKCSALKKITFTGGNVNIGKNAFESCENMEELNVGKAVLNWGEDALLHTTFDCITVEGGTLGALDMDLKNCEIRATDGSTVTYDSKDPVLKFTALDTLNSESTVLIHRYETGFFTKVSHNAPIASQIFLPITVTKIPDYFFGDDGTSCTVLYDGSKEDWSKIKISSTGNSNYVNGKVRVMSVEDRVFSVRFVDMEGKEIYLAENVAYGSHVSEPKLPDTSKDELLGWYSDSEYKSHWNFTYNTVRGDTTLYGLFLSAMHEHSYTEKIVAPTCNNSGYTLYTCECIPDKYSSSYKDNHVNALGHSYDYENIDWTWADNSATAKVTCVREGCRSADNGHTKTIEATIDETVIEPATCTENGLSKCVATITAGSKKYETSKTVVRQKTGHTMGETDFRCENCDLVNPSFTAVTSAQQLQNINLDLGGYYYLANDIDLGNANWTPIGTGYGEFTGILDGDGKKIKNLAYSVNNDNSKRDVTAGLFSVNNGIIRNLTVQNVTVNNTFTETTDGTWDDDHGTVTMRFGAIAGSNKATIENCIVSGSYSMTGYRELRKYFTYAKDGDKGGDHTDRSQLYYGGVAGLNSGTINACNVSATIGCVFQGVTESMMGLAGGVNSTVWYVAFFGSVGGIAGENYGTIAGSSMSGKLSYVSRLSANCKKNGALGIGVAGWALGVQVHINVGALVGNNTGSITGCKATKMTISHEHSTTGQTNKTDIRDNVTNSGPNGAYGANNNGKIDSIELLG